MPGFLNAGTFSGQKEAWTVKDIKGQTQSEASGFCQHLLTSDLRLMAW